MRDMHTLHDEVVITDARLTIGERSTVDNHILTDDIIITDDHQRSLATVVEVLRDSAQHGILVDHVSLADTGAVHQTDEGIDNTIVTYHDIIFYIYERIDRNIIAYLCFRTDYCFFANHIYGFTDSTLHYCAPPPRA